MGRGKGVEIMTYEQLAKANETIKTTDIKGKDYAEVNQRIKAFRMVETDGAIIPEIVSLSNGVCVMKATVLDSKGKVLAVGHAYEIEDSSFINKTSYIENCETSAVGRALGMCGFGIDTSIASYEEVKNAIENQKPKQIDKEENKVPFEDVKSEKKMTLEEALEIEVKTKDGIKKLKDLTDSQLDLGAKNWAFPEWVEGARLILLYREGQHA